MRRLALGMSIAVWAIATHGPAPASTPSPVAHAQVIGDVTGDGSPDVLARRGPQEPWTNLEREISVHRGTDGTPAWSAAYAHPVTVTPLNLAAGVPGAAVTEMDETDFAQRLAKAVEVRRHDGTIAWRRTFTPGVEIAGIGRYSGAASDDLILVRATPAIATRVFVVEIVDGGTGRTRSTAALTALDLRVLPAGDLSGDGLSDLVFWIDGAYGSLVQARTATHAAPLWTMPWVRPSSAPLVFPSGDLTGDGRGDLVLEDQAGDPTKNQTRVHALDGATGRTIWSRSHWLTGTVADIDADGDLDVVGWLGARGGIAFLATDGSGQTTTRAFPAGERNGVAADAWFNGPAGDLDADGVPEQRIEFLWEGESERQAVSLRFGASLMVESFGTYLNASVDGNGDDVVEMLTDGDDQRVTTRDVSGQSIWSAHLDDTDFAVVNCWWMCAADVSGDGRAEILAFAPGRIWMLDGFDGHLRWTI